jgi:hypothetical protein
MPRGLVSASFRFLIIKLCITSVVAAMMVAKYGSNAKGSLGYLMVRRSKPGLTG